MSIIRPAVDSPPLPRCSVFEYLFPKDRDTSHDTSPAFIDGLTGRQVTRGQVHDHALKLAGGLAKLGLKKGDVACIHGLNSIEWINAQIGCQAARLIVSPANYAYTPPELLHQLQDSGASVVFVDTALLSNLQNALKLDGAPKIPSSRIILLCQPENRPTQLKDFACISEIWTTAAVHESVKEGEEHQTTCLCYSSGTTGRAKGVETTHYNFTSQFEALKLSAEPLDSAKDITLGMLPFGHMYLFSTGILRDLSIRVPMVIIPRFNELDMLRAIQKYKVTFALVVPPVLITLLNSTQAANYDLSSLRAVMSAAAPLGTETVEAFEKKFNIRTTQGYGLTEVSPISHIMTVAEAASRPGKIGRIIPTYEARLVSMDGGDGPVERGEIWLRGPSVMKGYWRNPSATENTFAEGRWFKTGDIAVIDEEGYFSIVDRVKELIKYKGFQVPPAELEALLLSNDKVADAAVIGVLDSDGNELPRAYVVPVQPLPSLDTKQRMALSKEIGDWVAKSVAPHKRLRGGVILIEAIPKTPSGKILRKDLRVMAAKEGAIQARL